MKTLTFFSNLCFLQDMGTKGTEFPPTLEDLDKTIAAFDSVEQLLKSLYPETWRQDLDSIYAQTYIYYRSRAYYLSNKHNKGKIYRSKMFWDICICRVSSIFTDSHAQAAVLPWPGKKKLVKWMDGCQWLYCRGRLVFVR